MCAAYNQMGEFIKTSSLSWGGGEMEYESDESVIVCGKGGVGVTWPDFKNKMLLQRNPRPHCHSSRSTQPPRPVINNRFVLIPEDGVNTGLVSIIWQRENEHCLVSALPASKSYTGFSKKTGDSQARQTAVQRTRIKRCLWKLLTLKGLFFNTQTQSFFFFFLFLVKARFILLQSSMDTFWSDWWIIHREVIDFDSKLRCSLHLSALQFLWEAKLDKLVYIPQELKWNESIKPRT